MLTQRDCAIITAYTGILIGKFEWTHEYIEELLGRPVFTHELGSKVLSEKIKELSYSDFVSISESVEGE